MSYFEQEHNSFYLDQTSHVGSQTQSLETTGFVLKWLEADVCSFPLDFLNNGSLEVAVVANCHSDGRNSSQAVVDGLGICAIFLSGPLLL